MTMEKVSSSLLYSHWSQTFACYPKCRVREMFMPGWQHMTGRAPVLVRQARCPAAGMAMQA